MPATVLYGILTFVLILGPLIILHELGHLIVARRMGVKTLEFGIGFPPRAAAIRWTGRTIVRLSPDTRYKFEDQRTHAQKGDLVTALYVRNSDGAAFAHTIRPVRNSDDSARAEGAQLIIGKVKEVSADEIVIADMLWSINWLPIGGFVRMVGEEDPSGEGSLASKGPWQRIGVMGAGAAVNAVLPFLIFPVVLLIPQEQLAGDVIITRVMPGSPAEAAGIRDGDKVMKVDGRTIHHVGDLQQAVTLKLGAVSTWVVQRGIPDPFPQTAGPQYQYTGETETIEVVPRWRPPRREIVESVTNPETQMSLREARLYNPLAGLANTVHVVAGPTDRTGEISLADAREIHPDIQLGEVLQVTPTVSDPRTEISLADARRYDFDLGTDTFVQDGAVGVQIDMVDLRTESRSLPPWEAIPRGLQGAYEVIILTKNAITGLIIGSTNPQFSGPSTVGPVGIGQVGGEVATADASLGAKIAVLASLAGALSFSLAVINILPIPALDGGRIFFVVVELLRRGKRISPRREGLVHLIGFALLIGVIALISAQDIARIVRGESFFN